MPLSYIAEYAGGVPEGAGKIISGGPMMGRAIANLDAATATGTIVVDGGTATVSGSVQMESRCCICKFNFIGMGSDPDLTAKLWMAGVRHFKGLSASRAYHFETRSTGRVRRNNGRIQFMLKWGVNNSAVRRHLVHQGEPWGTCSAREGLSASDHRLTRLKAIWALLTGCQLGPIDPIQ